MFKLHHVIRCIAGSYLLFAMSLAAAEQHAIKFAVFPYVTPVQLVKFHEPLRALMEQTLGQRVTLITAPSFKEFIKRTHAGDYDIILTAPHLGRLAEVEDGYQRVAHTMHEVQGIYLATKASGIHDLHDLQGKVVTLVGRAAIITQMVEHQLRGLGLEDGKNIHFRFTRTHNNAMYAPLRGETDASVTGVLLWRKIGQHDRDKMQVIGKTPVAPGFMVMTRKDFDAGQRKKLETLLLSLRDLAKGRQYLETTGLRYFEKISDEEMTALDPYIRIFEKK